ncbi:ABC transporter permease [Prosthecomicrobium sp. N25]|uniref:ABC transporter permease n=1 Tax=Prosthecomicrobium sp. N25 TaxID=3129254 RepID=UPI003077E3A7
MFARIAALAASELRLGVRNRWVVLSVLILALFALALAFLGGGASTATRVDRLTLTTASLATLSVYLVPLIALLLSYDTLAGEIERGTLALVLATPAARTEVLLAKFVGHVAVITLAIVAGYGVAALAVIRADGWDPGGAVHFARLIGTAVLLGAAFVALGMLVSALVRQTGTAAAIAVGAWLVVVVLYDLGLLGALLADDGGSFTRTAFPWLLVANSGDAFRLYNLAAIGDGAPTGGLDGAARTLPFPPATALAVLGLWLAGGIAGAHLAFRRTTP